MSDDQQVEKGLATYRRWFTTAVTIIANDIAEGNGAGRLDEMMDELSESQAKALLRVQVAEQALAINEHPEQQQWDFDDLPFAETS